MNGHEQRMRVDRGGMPYEPADLTHRLCKMDAAGMLTTLQVRQPDKPLLAHLQGAVAPCTLRLARRAQRALELSHHLSHAALHSMASGAPPDRNDESNGVG